MSGVVKSVGPHELSVEEAVALVQADPARGPASDEAARRLRTHGPNALPPPRRRGSWRRLAQQFHTPLIDVLIAAAAVSAAIGELVEAS